MKTLYFDLMCGASGDIILSALFDLGINPQDIINQLKSLPISEFDISVSKETVSGITCKKTDVKVPHEHVHRHLSDIERIINESSISSRAKKWSLQIFKRIAKAEATVHNIDIEKVHFHEVGAMDSIIDVIGACIGFDMLDIDAFFTSDLTIGNGTVECAHGVMPVPAPATSELIKGFPVTVLDTKTEILTPTGAGIITTLAKHGLPKNVTIKKTGYGTGQKKIEGFPNFSRIWIGETKESYKEDEVLVMETNIDDGNPEILSYVMDKLFAKGALDVFFMPVYMKKNRPGTILKVIAPINLKDELSEIIFRETTTLGIRISQTDRIKIKRETVTIKSPWGNIKVKKNTDNTKSRYLPEFEECKKVAKQHNIPLTDIYNFINGY